jgi:Tetratricopeptide repeat.
MFKTLLASFLLLSCLTSAFCQDNPLLQSGFEKINTRNFEGAIIDFNQLISINPANVEALCGRAEARINIGSYADALKDAEAALQVDANNSKALSLKGEAQFNLKDYNNSLKTFDIALSKSNPPAMATIGKAKVLNQLGSSKESYKLLDDAIAKKPETPDFYYARGILNSTKEKYAKALQDFEKTVELNANYNPFGVALNIGIAHLNLEEYDKAIESLTKAIAVDSKSAATYHTRGLARYAQEEYKEAVDDFLKSFDISPNPNTMFNLGMAYYKLNDKDNACYYFHKSCQQGNTNSCKMVIMVCSEGVKK